MCMHQHVENVSQPAALVFLTRIMAITLPAPPAAAVESPARPMMPIPQV